MTNQPRFRIASLSSVRRRGQTEIWDCVANERVAVVQTVEREADVAALLGIYNGQPVSHAVQTARFLDDVEVKEVSDVRLSVSDRWWEVGDGQYNGAGQTIAVFRGERAREMATHFAAIYSLRDGDPGRKLYEQPGKHNRKGRR